MSYARALENLRAAPRVWVVTGCAGFIGSHLTEALLGLGQRVVGLDDFSTGTEENLADVHAAVGDTAWANLRLIRGTVCEPADCRAACAGADFVLHQAGFISVPASMEDPARCHAVNVDGFLHLLIAARDAGVERLVYASSSAVYGDDPSLPKRETQRPAPLSPYGTSKLIDELYAEVFYRNYQFGATGLRYFNIFGPRQNPSGGYAAVIPRWINQLLAGEPCHIHGDGSITRDFCHVSDVAQANILAAMTGNSAALGRVFNVGLGAETTLLELYETIRAAVAKSDPSAVGRMPIHDSPRPGDIQRSVADLSASRAALGFEPATSVAAGLDQTIRWYATRQAPS